MGLKPPQKRQQKRSITEAKVRDAAKLNKNSSDNDAPDTITLVMIVKNENPGVLTCLESVWQYVARYDICDTGSTDGTQAVIKKFFDEKGIPGEVYQHDWVGFSVNRTLAFQVAEGKAKWMFVIDADDRLLTPLKIPKKTKADWISVTINENTASQQRKHIFRSGLQWGYEGIVHEYPYSVPKESERLMDLTLKEIVIEGTRTGFRSQNPNKYLDDAKKLEGALEELVKIPKSQWPHWRKNLDARYVYYIAQSYWDHKMYEESIAWYTRRLTMGGFKEEIYRSYMKRAYCYQWLRNVAAAAHPHASPSTNSTLVSNSQNLTGESEYTSEYIIGKFMEAYEYEKYRAEASYEIAKEYYVSADKSLYDPKLDKAWEFIQLALDVGTGNGLKLRLIKDDLIYNFEVEYMAAQIGHRLGFWKKAYAWADALYYRADRNINDYRRKLVYHEKHKNVKELLKIYRKYITPKIRPSDGGSNKIVFNLTVTSYEHAKDTLSSFISTCTDHINIDRWYYSVVSESASDQSLGTQNEFPELGSKEFDTPISEETNSNIRIPQLEKDFPFLIRGKDVGQVTINVTSDRIFFHRGNLIEKICAVGGVKILYLNRNASDELFDANVPTGMFEVKRPSPCPYVVYDSNRGGGGNSGMWSVDFVSSLHRNALDKT